MQQCIKMILSWYIYISKYILKSCESQTIFDLILVCMYIQLPRKCSRNNSASIDGMCDDVIHVTVTSWSNRGVWGYVFVTEVKPEAAGFWCCNNVLTDEWLVSRLCAMYASRNLLSHVTAVCRHIKLGHQCPITIIQTYWDNSNIT